MKKIACSQRTLVSALIVVGGLSFATPASAASRDNEALKRWLGTGVRVAEHRETGKVRFVGTRAGQPIARPGGLSRSASPSRVARAFFESHGDAFGIGDQARDLRVTGTEAGAAGRTAVRFQQLHDGVPVLGGELVVNLDAERKVLSASGESLPDADVTTSPQVGSAAARETAIASVAKDHAISVVRLNATVPSLWIYDSRILGGPGLERPALVWRIDVKGGDEAIHEMVLVDASSGSVALRINQIENALNRTVCDANNTDGEPGGAYPCTAPVRSEGGAAVGFPQDVNLAYEFAGDTYDFFFTNLGRDSIDGAGLPLKSTVRYCDPTEACPYANAFWDGAQMVYGQGFASADDVVGHELTHGVTDFSAHLFYYYQSGAINESLSDVFGEFVDLTNGAGNDAPGVRWQMGEDLMIGAIRSMSNPPAFGDPDKITSGNYTADPNETDSGGVHQNSGVNNKAAFLMTDGGTFNGHTVVGLGIPKVARIYYTVQTSMLTSASDYADLGSALQQACTNLIGTVGITATDCTQVGEAVAAVEMNTVPPAAPTTSAPVCPGGLLAANVFFDNVENSVEGDWATQGDWYYPQSANPYEFDATYATSGTGNIWGYDRDVVGDYSIAMNSNVAIPAGSTAYLRFNHAYGFEDDGAGAYDGGMLEYSVNSGGFADIGPLLTDGGYNGTLTTISNNPLEGRPAFVRESNGYGTSRATLSSLAGQNVRFRFRIGTDGFGTDYGWFIDDVRIYTCSPPGTDSDADATANENDNCAYLVNSDQANADGDSKGDACDPDDDNDRLVDGNDNCRTAVNPDQADLDGDRAGNACDPDDDNDGVADVSDACPTVAFATPTGCAPPAPPVIPPVVTPAATLTDAKVRSCRRTGRARKTRVICMLTGFGAVSRATLKVTRRGRTVASGSAKPSKAGTLTIKGKRTLRRGSYRVTLTLRDASGKTRKLTRTFRAR